MHRGISTVERAFQLAQSGRYKSVEEIRRAVIEEGFYGDYLYGPVLFKQLRGVITKAEASASSTAKPTDKSYSSSS